MSPETGRPAPAAPPRPGSAAPDPDFFLRKAQQIAKIGHFTYDPSTRKVEGSSELFRIFGLGPGENRVEDFARVIHPDDWPRIQDRVLQGFRDKPLLQAEFRLRLEDRTIVHVEGRGEILDSPTGRQLVGTVQDITDQVLFREFLRQSEDRFRLALESAPVPLMFHAEDGEVLTLSRAWTDLTGYTLTDIPTTDAWAERAYGPRQDLIKQEIAGLYRQSARRDEGEYEIRCRDGSVRTWDFSSSPVGSLLDGRRAVISMAKDVTDRKRAEEALRESEYFFKESQKAAAIGSYKTDFLQDRWESSEVLDQIFGIDPGYDRSVAGWLALVHPDDRAEMDRYLREDVIAGGKPFSHEYRIIRPANSEVRWVSGLGKVTFDDRGTLVSLIGTIQDITERKQTEALLQNTQKLEALGVLAGGIAHDFNNLMGSVFGFLNLADLKNKDPEVKKHLDKAQKAIDRARGLTRQLLTFARGGDPVRTVEALFPFLKETVDFALSGSPVTGTFDVEPGLWPCSIDKGQIGQAVDNLVINAIQAMPKGGVVRVTARNCRLGRGQHPILPEGGYVRLSFQDEGPGIAPEILPRIFDPFFSTKPRGQGLGLATGFSIVQRHGGTLEAESRPGGGATFRLWLPVAAECADPVPVPGGEPHRGHGRVLVMDDEASLREVLSGLLGSLGYQVTTRNNGQDAVAWVREAVRRGRPPVFVLLDLTVPNGMGGREALEEIRTFAPGLPVLVASGYAEDPILADPARYGFQAGLRKPFVKPDIEAVLNRILDFRTPQA